VASGQLWYAAAVVKEALRLYPPIPLFPRVAAADDDTLPGGHEVRAGEVVFLSAYAVSGCTRLMHDLSQRSGTDARTYGHQEESVEVES
jgi:cytochrome P450